ncbi:MAG: hypothetical protein CFE21_14880 [Bacteroidetes bacterium B1(2017)]|nr:MAG: hypothetical protein CFE21_14880 [Bacteroidetes bacterium B1(2017)]
MHKNLFEYAIIRVVPMVEREEFINVGVILFCKDLHYLGSKIELNSSKLLALAPTIDIQDIQANLSALQQICDGKASTNPISQLSTPERFRWLTATRSTLIQCSKVHPGFCAEPSQELEKLFEKMIL